MQGKFSISKVLPEERPWIPADQWTTYPRKARARKHYNDEGRAKWKKRHLASRHMKDNAVYHLAQAKRSVLIMSLDIDVGTGALPEKWLAVNLGPERFAYGLCDLPPLEDKMTKRICYVNEPPARSLIPQVTEIPAVNPANAFVVAQVIQIPLLNAVNEWMAVKDVDVDTRDNQIPLTSLTKDVVVFPSYPLESADDIANKTWAAIINANAEPYKLRNQPDNCLVDRRIARDTNNNNKITDDSYAMIHTEKYLSRVLCSEPRQLGISLFCCECPRYFVHELSETAMAVAGVQVDRRNKDRYDLGIRRWLADAGCGYDLVQTSTVEELGGQSLIRLREPKYLQTANVVTPLHHEITMRILQLDEFAEILRVRNTISVISIGEGCVGMEYCFHWPPYSESPFFVKPDGTRVTCSVENNTQYLEGGYDENDCPGVERPTQAVDGRPGSLDDEIDERATPRGDESSQDANMVPQGGKPNVRDDDGDGAGTSRKPGDVEPVYSRDFRDTANEALAMRLLATHNPS
jgi:hypothetical protein